MFDTCSVWDCEERATHWDPMDNRICTAHMERMVEDEGYALDDFEAIDE